MNHDKIVERVRKLLALAKSANEHEAALAAFKAQELLTEYNLKLDDVKEGDTEELIIDGEMVSDSRPWRRAMAANLARLYFCSYHYRYVYAGTAKRACGYIRYDRHHFAGAPHNVAVCKSIFAYLCDTIDRLAKESGLKQPVRGRAMFMTSFRHAAANRVTQRLADKWSGLMRGTDPLLANANKNLPMVLEQTQERIEQFVQQQAGEIKSVVQKAKIHSLEGALAGRKAGDGISLESQIEQSASPYLLGSK